MISKRQPMSQRFIYIAHVRGLDKRGVGNNWGNMCAVSPSPNCLKLEIR